MTEPNSENELSCLLNNSSASPFLFIGAGFSRRYIALETWQDLLAHFCHDLKDFHYYLSTCESDLTKVATLMAKDFHELFWKSPLYDEDRKRIASRLKNTESALKFTIAKYVERKSINATIPEKYNEEIEALGKLNVDGIITTNWDCFLEQKFPDYKVFVGQEDLLYSKTQGVCEIYKIHGCVRRPDSLVLTSGDYERFREKNAYLAAKLITIFMEHPIIFMGYSLQDSNICNLLCSMAQCLGDKVSLLKNNLIFVEWSPEHPFTIKDSCIVITASQTIPITLIKTDSFLPIFEALAVTKRKIPAKLLRYCKESIYNLVLDSSPQNRKNICVVGLEDIEDETDIEFVIGLGITQQLGGRGYSSIDLRQIFHDILFDDASFKARNLMLETMVTSLSKGRKYLPVFKYLRKEGITSAEEFHSSEYIRLEKFVNVSNYKCRNYARAFVANANKCSVQEIINKFDTLHQIVFLEYAKIQTDELSVLGKFLQENFEKCFDSDNVLIKNEYRKLVRRYDRLKFGWS